MWLLEERALRRFDLLTPIAADAGEAKVPAPLAGGCNYLLGAGASLVVANAKSSSDFASKDMR